MLYLEFILKYLNGFKLISNIILYTLNHNIILFDSIEFESKLATKQFTN
jgi:hypothetical protein